MRHLVHGAKMRPRNSDFAHLPSQLLFYKVMLVGPKLIKIQIYKILFLNIICYC